MYAFDKTVLLCIEGIHFTSSMHYKIWNCHNLLSDWCIDAFLLLFLTDMYLIAHVNIVDVK